MEPTTQNNTLRSLLIFIIIGAVLLTAIILGVRWAKGRSNYYANVGQPTSQQASAPAQKSTPASEPDQNSSSSSSASTSITPNTDKKVAVNPTTAATPETPSKSAPITPVPAPSNMPSTGIEDAFLPIGALATAVFAGITYVQSRRRLRII